MRYLRTNAAILLFFAILFLMGLACSFPTFALDTPLPTAVLCPTCEPCESCELVLERDTATQTPAIQHTPTSEPTVTLVPTSTLLPSPTPETFPYILQPGTPSYIPNLHHLEYGSNWLGVGGQVFGPDGIPVEYIVVRVRGSLEGESVDLTSMTGVADYFGPGGYDLKLGDRGIESTDTLTITLFDLAGKQISEEIPFATHQQTDQVQIVINFMSRP
ncbi:MAG: hypothetical protein HPY85_01810 [Anaerolineae bacterium]|nr:hypothetical protein [Anaerolineae bacterium]